MNEKEERLGLICELGVLVWERGRNLFSDLCAHLGAIVDVHVPVHAEIHTAELVLFNRLGNGEAGR
jgi:hypothetical protein